MQSSGKKTYTDLKSFIGDHTKVSILLIENYINILIFFFAFDFLLLVLFACSLLLKKMKRVLKIRSLYVRIKRKKREMFDRLRHRFQLFWQEICRILKLSGIRFKLFWNAIWRQNSDQS